MFGYEIKRTPVKMLWCFWTIVLLAGLSGCGGDSKTQTPPPAQNKAPVAGNNQFQLQEDSNLEQRIVATDADNDPLTYQLQSTANASGTVTLQPDGHFTYKPAADFFGQASFTFTISDGKNTPVQAEAKLTVQNINDLPVVENQQFNATEDQQFVAQLVATDVDNDVLNFTLLSSEPAVSGVTVSGNGVMSLKPFADFNGPIRLQLQVTDNKAAAIPFTAEISVAAVNDAPELMVKDLPSVLDVNASYTLDLSVNDVDGDKLTLKNLNPEAFQINFDQNPVQLTVLPVASASQQQIRIEVSDPHGSTTQHQQSVLVALPNETGMGRTLVGEVHSNRLNLVIVGDGFTDAEQEKLRNAAYEFSKVFFSFKEIGMHREGWSIHVLDAHSAESGADDPTTNTTVDTLFDGHFGCANIYRLYCVNESKVFDYVLQHYPQHDFVLVVGNTTIYGGAGGRVATYTLNEQAIDIAVHELGHTFARLADEYDYGSTATALEYTQSLCEDCYANVTAETDLTKVKWRHWFSSPNDPVQNGVGLFEGAFYQPHGFYRPKNDSFMRTLRAPIGEVNAEAWANQLYQTIGMYHSPQPQDENVLQLRGQELQFSLELSVGSAQQQIKWLLNGQPLPQFDNKTSISCCQDQQQNYQLSAVITDISGLIKKPSLQSTEVKWNVQIQ